jgi:hypothetical protein
MPWNLGTLYYLHSPEAHAGLMRDVIDRLLPAGRQLKSNAHPLVEITFMKQWDRHLSRAGDYTSSLPTVLDYELIETH